MVRKSNRLRTEPCGTPPLGFIWLDKARSHDPILRIRFLVPKIGSRRSYAPMSRFRFCVQNVGRSFVVCSHDPIFRTNI